MKTIVMWKPVILQRFAYLNRLDIYFRRNFKTKREKNVKPKVAHSDRALEHFDLHYRPVYRQKWPSIRIALLTAKKHCAVINNHADNIENVEDFVAEGAYDIVQAAFTQQQQNLTRNAEMTDKSDKVMHSRDEIKQLHATDQVDESHSDGEQEKFENKNDEFENESDEKFENESNENIASVKFDKDEDDRKDLDRTNLFKFRPAETVYSEFQALRIEEAKRSIFTPMDVKVDIVKPRQIKLPLKLKALGFPSGDVTNFPDVKLDRDSGLLCYYLLDAASLLPVIALDLARGDSVLDLCAAPGGKSLSILQTELAGNLLCNDLSGSRVSRLLNILQYYIPEEKRQHVDVKRRAGQTYDQPEFDKVLVDVPCNTDRHVLSVDENNLFNPMRINERIEMPNLQKELLLSGIKACRPGGCVVYSTCTLSPAQNDGVVQNALDDLWRNTSIDVVVEDLEEITHLFKDTFEFYSDCRFGQLVIPSLSQNYGPMYFSRLRRIS